MICYQTIKIDQIKFLKLNFFACAIYHYFFHYGFGIGTGILEAAFSNFSNEMLPMQNLPSQDWLSQYEDHNTKALLPLKGCGSLHVSWWLLSSLAKSAHKWHVYYTQLYHYLHATGETHRELTNVCLSEETCARNQIKIETERLDYNWFKNQYSSCHHRHTIQSAKKYVQTFMNKARFEDITVSRI